MNKKKNSWMLPLLIAILMLASSFAIIGAVSGAETPTAIRAGGKDGKILYIYDNKGRADDWYDFLTGANYTVNLVPVNGTENIEYDLYDLVIIGSQNSGVPAIEVEVMQRSGVPILGIGYGGATAYVALGGSYNYFTHPNADSRFVNIQKDLSFYNIPESIPHGVPESMEIFNTNAADVTYSVAKNAESVERQYNIGYYNTSSDYATIMQKDNFLLFGYTQSPAGFTPNGAKLMRNIIYHMADEHNYNIGIPRITSRITIDGFANFEWIGAHYIPLTSDGKNYTMLAEDEDYLYVLMNLANSSATDDYMAVWFEKDNNKTDGAVDTSAFYILLSEVKPLSYREVSSYNTWGPITPLDGSNINGTSSSTSSTMVAEFKISKNYLKVTRNIGRMMGIGITWRSESATYTFPSNFKYQEANTGLTTYSDNHWKGQVEKMNAPLVYSAPTIDGKYSSEEWHGASNYYVPTNGHTFSVSVCHDNSNVYVGGYMTNVSGAASDLYFYFDPLGDGGSSPQTDDFKISIGKTSSDVLFKYEQNGTGSQWGSYYSLPDSQASLSLRGGYVYFELSLPYSKMSLSHGSYRDINVSIVSIIDGETYVMNRESENSEPGTWNITLYSSDHWDLNNGRNIDARNGSAVTIDGSMSPGEWDDSFEITYPASSGNTVYTYVKTGDGKLYIAFRYYNPNQTDQTYVGIALDVNYDRGSYVDSDDLLLVVTYNGDKSEYTGDPSSGWQFSMSYGWNFSMSTGTYWIVEFAIDYSKLNITPGVDSELGIMFFLNDEGNGYGEEPAGGDNVNPSTWDTVTTSDNWGSSTIPELNTLFVLIALFIPAAVIIRRRF